MIYLMRYVNNRLDKNFKFGVLFILTLVVGCDSDSLDVAPNENSTEALSIESFNCQSDPVTNYCRDTTVLSVNFNALGLDNITGTITSMMLGLSQEMILVDGKLQAPLADFSGATDVSLTLAGENSASKISMIKENIGTISVNSAPTCSPTLVQNFDFNDNDGSVALIDIATCDDAEGDQIVLSHQVLDTTVSGDYSNTVSITDEFGLTTGYIITGNVADPGVIVIDNLTIVEFTNEMIANPSVVGANSCFVPINQVFDETVVCDFVGEWHGFQYDSTVDISSFANVALVDSAQGFTNFAAGPTLNDIVAGFAQPNLPDNQEVANLGNVAVVIAATIERDFNGDYANSNISGAFNLQGSATENSTIRCENQTYTLPISAVSGARASTHTINKAFIEAVGKTETISNCVATNNQGIDTVLEGDINIVVTDVVRPSLTIVEFTSEIIADPSAVGANSCFAPINQVFDETVVCNFAGEWHGFQYGSSVDTSSFTNVALVDSAQGFTNFAAGPALNDIVAGFSIADLPDNQAVTNPGVPPVVIIATIDREPNGNYINSNISGAFNLQGMTTENSLVRCENQTYTLPISAVSGIRASSHSIDQAFIENVGQTETISNCVATNNQGIDTVLEGDINITVTDIPNQSPAVNSVNGITQGFEGNRTVVANVTDADDNLSTVTFRYRVAGSGAAWTELTLAQQGTTDNYSATAAFNYPSNLNENGTIEYQVIAEDIYNEQDLSTLASTTFYANEATAQAVIEDEIALDPNKTASCFDCTYTDPASGSTIGPFDALFNDAALNDHAYEYNGEERSAADMTTLANSVIGTIYDFHEIPIGTVTQIRTNIQNN